VLLQSFFKILTVTFIKIISTDASDNVSKKHVDLRSHTSNLLIQDLIKFQTIRSIQL